MAFVPLSVSHLTQFLGLASTRRATHLLQDPRSRIPEVTSGLPEWERYLRWLLLDEGGPRRKGDFLVLPVRDHKGMSPKVALVSLDVPYGAYHCGYVVAPIPKDAGPGLYLVLPGLELEQAHLEPLLSYLSTPRRRPTPLAVVLGEAGEALLEEGS